MLLFNRIELLLQNFNLLSVLPQQGVLRILVDFRLILYAFRTVGVPQRREGLLIAGGRG